MRRRKNWRWQSWCSRSLPGPESWPSQSWHWRKCVPQKTASFAKVMPEKEALAMDEFVRAKESEIRAAGKAAKIQIARDGNAIIINRLVAC